MQFDSFGNLRDWGPVLDQLRQLTHEGKLGDHQPELIRILRYQGNWRLREEVLHRISSIEQPSKALLEQVLRIIADKNIYFEARILACQSMANLLKRSNYPFDDAIRDAVVGTLAKLLATPEPPIFTDALRQLSSVAQKRFNLSEQ